MNKKGFTLMELLGVLIILGIITAITVGMVYNQYQKSKTNSYIESTRQYINLVNIYIVNYDLEENVTSKYLYDAKYYLKKINNLFYEEGKNNIPQSYTILNPYIVDPISNIIEFSGSAPQGEEDYIIIENSKVVGGVFSYKKSNDEWIYIEFDNNKSGNDKYNRCPYEKCENPYFDNAKKCIAGIDTNDTLADGKYIILNNSNIAFDQCKGVGAPIGADDYVQVINKKVTKAAFTYKNVDNSNENIYLNIDQITNKYMMCNSFDCLHETENLNEIN